MIIGTRGSRLALWQANYVKAQLAELGITAELKIIKTQGDKIQHLTFDKLEGKGFFTKEIEDSLLAGDIDVAVHSLKDMPTEHVEGLTFAALSYRASVNDLIIVNKSKAAPGKPFQLPDGATVGTSSNRRKAQLRDLHPGLVPVDIRGNVPTRLEKARTGEMDAVVLAAAGLERLELDLSDMVVIRPNPREFVPAPGQGVMALQTRQDAMEIRKQLAPLHHVTVGECTNVERTVLNMLEGGCSLPLGVYCEQDQLGNYHVWAAYADAPDAPVKRVQISRSTRAGLPEAVIAALREG